MSAALIVRFRPVGPWRFGPTNGMREHVDRIFHSDSLYSALTIAMRDLGWLEEWLDATARSTSPVVRLSSCYPYVRRTLLVQPPRSVWPPAQSGKMRWKSARFVPVSLIPALLNGGEELNEQQWAVEPISGCLLPVERNNVPMVPFRLTQRVSAPVDRLGGGSEVAYLTACLQFAPSAGVWFVASFADGPAREKWMPKIRSAARLLADSGVGGERSRGWGRSAPPAFEDVDFPGFLLGGPESNGGGERAWWMLSLFKPAESDTVDWTRGNYEVIQRAGRADVGGSLKPAARMVAEGSVVLSGTSPVGLVEDVAPADVPHPVYRSGVALAVPIAWHESRRLSWLAGERPQATPPVVEEPSVGTDALALAGALTEVSAPDTPEADAPAEVSAPDTPEADAPAEVAATDAPEADASAEVSAADAPEADAPAEVSAADAPETDTPAEVFVADAPETDAPAEVSAADAPETDAPAEVSAADAPEADAPAEVSGTEFPDRDTPAVDVPATEIPEPGPAASHDGASDEPPVQEPPSAGEPPAEEPPSGEPPVEEPPPSDEPHAPVKTPEETPNGDEEKQV